MSAAPVEGRRGFGMAAGLELLDQIARVVETVGDARRKIGCYLEFYNSRRPHSNLGAQTSGQVYFHRPPEALAA